MSVSFKDDPFATGFFAPMRFEADIHDCEVDGTIPTDIDGTFYRTCVDRRYPQLNPADIPYNADGAVDMFRIRQGHVDFRSKYIRTPRYIVERRERRSLFGVYRNASTNDPLVAGMSINTGNTTPIVHADKLFSLKESSPPMLLDPHTLRTVEEHDFGGKLTATSFTAHPKIDPVSGEMLAFSYEAKGDLSDDLAVHFFDPQGNLTRTVWFKAPVVSMMHDWMITQEHVILPTTGMVTSAERLLQGLNHWAYDPTVPAYVGILPRNGDAGDVRWFRGPPDRAMLVHATNARTVGNKVILDAPVARGNFNPQFANVDGSPFDHEARKNTIRRWTFDLNSTSDTWEEEILFPGILPTSFSRIDDRYITQDFRWSFNLLTDDAMAWDAARGGDVRHCGPNAWYRFDHAQGTVNRFCPGPTHALFEPQFVPRRDDAPEGDGYLIGVANDFAEMKSELVIADAQHLEEGPIARVKLPFRLHMQVHGWWTPASVLPFEFGKDYDYDGPQYR
ncbi:MAG TPA: carotenoid oxygenase family protein [Paracoccaceae bacterium]|nr:carotenoid oxygenase family protein [Paracoccaceae bacterium]